MREEVHKQMKVKSMTRVIAKRCGISFEKMDKEMFPFEPNEHVVLL
jgi:hypothetical protein